MEYQKQFGTIVMVFASFFSFLALLMSDSACSNSDIQGFDYFVRCMFIYLFEELEDNPYSAAYILPTKYCIAFCGFIFALGFLWYRSAIKAPKISFLENPNGFE